MAKFVEYLNENNPLVDLFEEKTTKQFQIVVLTSSVNKQNEKMDKAPTVQKIETYCEKHKSKGK